MEINKAGAGQGMVALGLSPWVDYILPDRAPSAGVGHRTKALHPDTLAYFRPSASWNVSATTAAYAVATSGIVRSSCWSI